MTRKPKQKEETRWCLEYPDGTLDFGYLHKTERQFLKLWERDGPSPLKWKYALEDGYKCVKIKIRRA